MISRLYMHAIFAVAGVPLAAGIVSTGVVCTLYTTLVSIVRPKRRRPPEKCLKRRGERTAGCIEGYPRGSLTQGDQDTGIPLRNTPRGEGGEPAVSAG